MRSDYNLSSYLSLAPSRADTVTLSKKVSFSVRMLVASVTLVKISSTWISSLITVSIVELSRAFLV